MHIKSENNVFKKVLDNGLTILVRPTHAVPKVSIQLWYNVGSKDERTGEKGIAHLIEHMIFKGTEKLSESDINMITQKLSGICNAFTSYDYTGYLFDFPSHHWYEALPIMADCMTNCTFKQQLLNSEMKAVIQELKMYRDNYSSSLIEHMISTIFNDHPYHYPIIGFKQDLWNLKHDDLWSFYKKHYHPNNATLVVVGDVSKNDVIAYAQDSFGTIKPDLNYKKERFHHTGDLVATTTTLYRDIKVPQIALCYLVPGAHDQQNYFLNVLSWILGSGKNSRLQKKLVDELQLATQLETFVYDLFDYGLFFIYFQPKDNDQIETIIKIIHEEIDLIINQGVAEKEIIRATKQVESDYLDLLENNQKQAYTIGQSFLATGNENYLFTYLDHSPEAIQPKIKELLSHYFKPALMHRGNLLPLDEKDKNLWLAFQQQSDKEDNQILSQIARESTVEEGVHVHAIDVKESATFDFPKPKNFTLDNGLTVLYYHNPNIPKIDLLMNFKAKSYYDPEDLQGLSDFMSSMLIEGTKNYTTEQLADEIESTGMSFESKPGTISMGMLSSDLQKALTILKEIVTNSSFPEEQIEKVRHQMQTELNNYWDSPAKFVNYLARKEIYKNHPYSTLSIGTPESLEKISRQDLLNAYKNFITPQETTLALVGDLQDIDVQKIITEIFGDWKGPKVADLDFPVLKQPQAHDVNYFINRDQIVLAFAGLSVSRYDKDFDKLLIFDQIFTGGVLGSMSSRLFELREQSGLFYTIGGSLLTHTDQQPGMAFIRTIVSADRLEEAEKRIAETIDNASRTISDDEYFHAQNALANSLVDNFETNKQIAATFLFLNKYKLPLNYFDTRAQQLANVTKQEIQEAVSRVLNSKKMVKIRVGRV
jgi:zinc protease